MSAFGQIDSLQNYNNLDVHVICAWLCEKGALEDLIAGVIAFQMFSQVSLSLCGQKLHIENRTSGALTGTRVAGQLGRVPVEASMIAVHSLLSHRGMPILIPCAVAEAWKPEYVDDAWEPVC